MKAQEGQSSTPATYMRITLSVFFLSVELNEIFVEELYKKYSVKTVHFSFFYIHCADLKQIFTISIFRCPFGIGNEFCGRHGNSALIWNDSGDN